MGAWVDTVEAKARIIHEQISSARKLAEANGASASEATEFYYQLLNTLYEEEFVFAQLADSSDLVARFAGPAVAESDPTVTIVTSVFSDLRNQIRQIAKSIAGLSDTKRLKWPSELDPHLSGLAHGSLVVGISIVKPLPSETKGQLSFDGISDELFESVRSAIRSLSIVPEFLGAGGLSDDIGEILPDPAIRDTVLVAASRLAPSGRKGIDSLTFFGDSADSEPRTLTPVSRRVLNQAINRPLKKRGTGTFLGIVREVDLDARRFEIRQVQNAGSIRCIYSPDQQDVVRAILDAQVEVSGAFETAANQQPRLIDVSNIKVVKPPEEQMEMDGV